MVMLASTSAIDPLGARGVESLEGRSLGRYPVVQRIAQGGMATVYLARQEGPGGYERPVAIKVVHPHLAREPRFAAMFLDEARLTGRLHHPNVCSVVDFGASGEQLYLVMEYLHGETFASVIRRGWARGSALSPALVARVIADAARGLHAAHELRDAAGVPLEIVHRDVSPQNLVVLYDGHTKLTDFGIARARGRLTDTTTGELKGKLSFMAPEQLQGAPVDRRADVWALGVVAWEALTGRRLFRGDNEGATTLNVLRATVAPPSTLARDVPPALDRAVTRALERDLSRRIATAAQLADELEEYLYRRGLPLGAPEIAAWMHAHFEDRIEQRAPALLGKPSVPVATIPEVIDDAPTTADAPVPEPTGVMTRWWKRSRARVAGAILGAGIAIGVAIASLVPRGGPAAPPPAREITALPPTAPSAPLLATTTIPEVAPTAPVVPAPTSAAAPARDVGERRARAPGRINLLAIPPAEVFLRGRSLGRTPLIGRALPAGAHVLELREVAGSRSERLRIDVRSGERIDRSVRFQ